MTKMSTNEIHDKIQKEYESYKERRTQKRSEGF